MKTIVLILIAGISIAILGPAATAPAQGRYIQLAGEVQWIAGQKLWLLPDGSTGVDIDLAQVPLDQYRGLKQPDRVIVSGLVARDNRKVYAMSIRRDDSY